MDLTAKYHLQRESFNYLTPTEGQRFTNITLKRERGLDLTLRGLDKSYFARAEL